MRKHLITTLVALVLLNANAAQVAATDGADRADKATNLDGADGPPPLATDKETAGTTSDEDEAGKNDDLIDKFTRHRPGACPEGPPCKVED